jgi:hypothetical protein
LRALNVRLFHWMLGEFFHRPKRAAVRVLEQLASEFPDLALPALRRAMRELGRDTRYLQTLYSREIAPRAFARFDACPEFALLAQTLPGYLPVGSP